MDLVYIGFTLALATWLVLAVGFLTTIFFGERLR